MAMARSIRYYGFGHSEHLKGLSHLQDLMLDNTGVTDAGLENLEGLSQPPNVDAQQHPGH